MARNLRKSRPFFKIGLVGRSVNHRWVDFNKQLPQVLQRSTSGPDLDELYEVALHCNAFRKSIQALRDYIFLEGYEWKKKWSRKCRECAEEHPPETKPEHCQECGSHDSFDAVGNRIKWYIEPDKSITQVFDKRFRKVDQNGHTLIEVLKMFEDHLNIADDSFLIVAQDYQLDEEGEIVKAEVREITVADPRNFKMVQDPMSQTPGGAFYICLAHRPGLHKDPRTGKQTYKGQVHTLPGNCNVMGCGRKLYDAWYVSTEPGQRDKGIEYYIDREVIHCSKYSTSYGYGMAPGISIFNMAATLIRMEEYIKTFYDEERPPRIAVFIGTSNPEGLREVMQQAEDINVSQGGHYVPKFTYDPGEGRTTGVQVVEFSKLPEELQFLEVRDEFYRRIGSAFDVAPVFHGNVDSVGLQSQGPTQWQVTKLGAKKAQDIYNTKVFPRLLELLDVYDWDLALKEPEEEDEMQKWQVKLLEVQYAAMMEQLGFGALTRDVEGHFEFPSVKQMMMGPMGPQPTGFMSPDQAAFAMAGGEGDPIGNEGATPEGESSPLGTPDDQQPPDDDEGYIL